MEHPKLNVAGERLGKDGPGLALAVYVTGLLWTNRHLTEGQIPTRIVRGFTLVSDPISVAKALVFAGLWEEHPAGFQVHDYLKFGNPSVAKVKAKREEDRLRKQQERAGTR